MPLASEMEEEGPEAGMRVAEQEGERMQILLEECSLVDPF